MTKYKYEFDIVQIDAWYSEEEGWTWNDTFHVGTMVTRADDIREAFRYWLNSHGLELKRRGLQIVYDGYDWVVEVRKTHEPVLACRPNFF